MNLYRAPSVLQPAELWPGRCISGRGMVDRHRQHQHVHVRDRTSLYSHGIRVLEGKIQNLYVYINDKN